MKKILFSLSLMSNLLVTAQSVILTVVDNNTKFAIADVNIATLNNGTVTNSEGKALINIEENNTLTFSNLNYELKSIRSINLKKTDTIYLIPKMIELDEVIVNTFNLKKSLQYVLDNYSKLYVDNPFEKDCDFKETVKVNGEFKRLILSKISWWDKSYELKNNPIKLRLVEIKYSKNEPFNIFVDVARLNKPSNNGFINLSTVISTIYLNTLLNSLIQLTDNSTIVIDKSVSGFIKVNFETSRSSDKISKVNQIIGYIVFDKKTKAIVEIDYTVNYDNNIVRDVIKENKKATVVNTEFSFLSATFYKTINNKISLRRYESGINMKITYDDKDHNAMFVNKINVLNETNIKKVSNKGLIDLSKPIYESLPSNEIKSSNSILLNSEEHDFIYGENKK